MNEKSFFTKIDFNKTWDEEDWEKFFQAHDSYRNSTQTFQAGQKPLPRIKFEGSDEVVAFEPIMRAYSSTNIPSIVNQLKNEAFYGDGNPDIDYHPATDQDPHYWGEGAPLATVLIYRDCCRFAICTAQEIEKFLKRKDLVYRKKFGAEFEALRFHANWVAINIGEGHKIGYSEERIRGNIAKCRRALHHADLCVGLISRISLRTKSMRLRRELFSFAFQLRNALFDWTDELRLKVN
jgi:hypothetical protein